MKKIFCMLLVIALVAMTTAAMAVEEDYSTLDSYLKEWMDKYGYEEYSSVMVDEHGVLCYSGIIDASETAAYYGGTFSVENWRKWSVDDFDMTRLDCKQIGEIEGNNVYYAEAESRKPLCRFDNKDWYKAKIVFMVLYDY